MKGPNPSAWQMARNLMNWSFSRYEDFLKPDIFDITVLFLSLSRAFVASNDYLIIQLILNVFYIQYRYTFAFLQFKIV